MKFTTAPFLTVVVLFFLIGSFSVSSQDFNPISKRQFDENFKERYTGNKYNYEGKETIRKSRSGSGRYTDYNSERPNDLKEENNSSNREITTSGGGELLDWLFILALLLAVIYLVYIIINEGGTRLFSSKKNRKIEATNEISVENIEKVTINSLIEEAEKQKDYRLAVRYYYLLVLKTLSEKKYITLEDDKTNYEYYTEIQNQKFSNGFSYISYIYNYIWYGEFPVSLEQYHIAKNNFVKLIQKVS